MSRSYRAFTLEALRAGPIDISGKVSELRSDIDALEDQIKADTLQQALIGSIIATLLLTAISYVVFNNLIFTALLFVALATASFKIRKMDRLQQMAKFSVFNQQKHEDLQKMRQDLDQLHEKAREYQRRLEFRNGPGLLSIYEDILAHPHYPSLIPYEERMRFVEMSERGQGSSLDILTYSRLMIELKECGYTNFVAPSEIYEQVLPKKKFNVTIEYAEQICEHIADKGADICEKLRFTGRIGYNAFLACSQEKQAQSVDTYENERWQIVEKILKAAHQGQIDELPSLSQQFQKIHLRLTGTD